jgi:hypothetical protein
MTGSSISRGRRLLMTFMLLAMVATGVALSAGGIAVAKNNRTHQQPPMPTIEATSFQVSKGQADDAYAVCPFNMRARWRRRRGRAPAGLYVRVSGPLDDTGPSTTQSTDIAKQW